MTHRLRITVTPPRAWTCANMSDAIRRDVERLGAHPEVSTLRIGTGFHTRRELNAVKIVDGDEARAGRWLFRMGVVLNNGGWRVARMRIDVEGDTPRALYHEARVQVSDEGAVLDKARELGFGIRSIKDGVYATLQSPNHAWLYDRAAALHLCAGPDTEKLEPPRICAVVHDTAPEMDRDGVMQS